MTNIKCKGGKEVDLLAIDLETGEKYHVEARVSTVFKLRLKATYTKSGKCNKDGVDYFLKEKFHHPFVKAKVQEILRTRNYKRILVVWDVADKTVMTEAKQRFGIGILRMPYILKSILTLHWDKGSRDDVLRTMELMERILDMEFIRTEKAKEVEKQEYDWWSLVWDKNEKSWNET